MQFLMNCTLTVHMGQVAPGKRAYGTPDTREKCLWVTYISK